METLAPLPARRPSRGQLDALVALLLEREFLRLGELDRSDQGDPAGNRSGSRGKQLVVVAGKLDRIPFHLVLRPFEPRARVRSALSPVSYTHLTLPTNREV